MKRIIMHNRSQSEDVLRHQPFSRAQVRPRGNRLTLANLERLPIPEPPQVTTKSDLGSIDSRSSSEKSRNKLEAIRQRELEFQYDEEDEDRNLELERRRSQIERDEPIVAAPAPPSPPPSPPIVSKPVSAPVPKSIRSASGEKPNESRRNQSRESSQGVTKELGLRKSREETRESSRDARREKLREVSASKSRGATGPDAQKVERQNTPEEVPVAPKDRPQDHTREQPRDLAREALQDLARVKSREPQRTTLRQSQRAVSRESHRTRVEEVRRTESQEPAREVSRPSQMPQDEDSDLNHIRNMGNHLRSLSANLNDVRTGMDNISKITSKPPNGAAKDDALVHMSDREVFDAVMRAGWASLWVARYDPKIWARFRVGLGFWLLLILAVPLYVMLECVSCMLWCRPVFAESMDGLGIYPDAPEMPYVIPTMLLRPLRPAWKPVVDIMAPVLRWLVDFSAYVVESSKNHVL